MTRGLGLRAKAIELKYYGESVSERLIEEIDNEDVGRLRDLITPQGVQNHILTNLEATEHYLKESQHLVDQANLDVNDEFHLTTAITAINNFKRVITKKINQ